MPLAVLNNPVMRAGCLTTACTQGVSIGLTIFVPLYYEMVHGLSASDSGLALIPIVMMTTPGSYLSGRAMLYMDRYKWVPIVMLSIAAAAVALLVVHPLMPVWAVALITGLVGIGTGSSYPTVTVSIQNAVAHRQIGVAMGAMNFFRALASAFVVAVMGAIMLADLGASPQRGGAASSAFIATAANASLDDLAPRLQPYFRGGGDLPDHRHRGADDHGRTAVAHHRTGRAGSARDAAARACGVAPSAAAA